jgi:hypothetical protein
MLTDELKDFNQNHTFNTTMQNGKKKKNDTKMLSTELDKTDPAKCKDPNHPCVPGITSFLQEHC